jgi:anti-sigma B factor antagonist
LNVPVVGRSSRAPRLSLLRGRRLTPDAPAAVDGARADEDVHAGSPESLPASDAAPSQRGFRVEATADEHHEILAPVGEFDASALAPFEEAITGVLEAERPIVIDLGRVTFIDSSGLWAITLTQRICRKRGIGLLLKPGPEQVQSVFEVTGLFDLLPFTSVASPEAS